MQKEIKKHDNKMSEENLKAYKLEAKLEDLKEKTNKKVSEVVHK